jgi:hypothetical protein
MKNYRKTKLYKTMDTYTATGLAEGSVESDNETEILTAWQKLHDTRIAYRLQNWFGRNAQNLIELGIILK